MFKAILLERADGHISAKLADIDPARLPAGDVSVRVEYSTINYKDGLAITGKGPVVRTWPMVPGIDLAGTVERSSDERWKEGDRIVVNGRGMGEIHWGGLAQRAHVMGHWPVALPAEFTPRQAMAIGTAGYTAMLCVMALEGHGVRPEDGEVLVTGASGGVGLIAVALLSGLGYGVVASTGRLREADHLFSMGASSVMDREQLAGAGKPLAKERWVGVVDTVGSHTLANACASTRYRGAVVACGLAQGMDFPATVAPFILRGISLYGVDSVMAPTPLRVEAWRRLSRDLDAAKLDAITREVPLSGGVGAASDILAGKLYGRTVVDVNR
jgi:acrylyl-CoA reductase (NADPH)